MTELEPCPFCGGKATIKVFLGVKVPICEKCMAVILPDMIPITETDVKMVERTGVMRWNTRVEK